MNQYLMLGILYNIASETTQREWISVCMLLVSLVYFGVGIYTGINNLEK